MESNPTYPRSTHKIVYVLVSPTAQIVINSTAENTTDHRFTILTSTSSEFTSGHYHYHKYAEELTGDNEKFQIEDDYVDVIEDFLNETSGYDDRTYEEQVLDLLKSAYKKVAAVGHVSISMPDGRSVSYDRAQLIKEIHNYQTQVDTKKGIKGRMFYRLT